MGDMLGGRVGSKGFPQLGHAVSPAAVTGLASSGKSSFGKAFEATPRVRLGTTARMEASEKTHPHDRRAMNGTAPDISRRDKGQTKGGRDGMFSVVEEDDGE